MTWLVQPSLVNEPFSDPGLFIDFRFGRRALLFDLGDLTPLSPRQLLRVTHAFVSHTHMDHFAGFDRLLRICLHRTTPLHLIGPVGFADRVEHKLRAYTLNLLDEDSVDFVIVASEFSGAGFDRVCEFHAREAFLRRAIPPVRLSPGLLLDEEEFRVRLLCLIMAFHALLSLSRRNCASMCGAKGCGDLDCPLDRGFVRPSVRCARARQTIARFAFTTV